MGVDLQTTEVVAVVATVDAGRPAVLTLGAADGVPSLPSGPVLADHRSLQAGLRSWVEAQTGLQLGFVEQLYTFADRERAGAHQRVISVSYVALARPVPLTAGAARWRGWYDLLPWEDRRAPGAEALPAVLRGGLADWVGAAGRPSVLADRTARVAQAFGTDERPWRPEDCLARYELLWEAGLLPESAAARRSAPGSLPPANPTGAARPAGVAMQHDHRRIVATGLARIRAKLQYRPVVFELMPETFTLGALQQVVEALSGTRLHKQNFRRLVEAEALVEDTGETTTATGGRPARLMRFRPDVLQERPAAGLRLPQARR